MVNAFALIDRAIREAAKREISQNAWARSVDVDPGKLSRIRRRLALPTFDEALNMAERGGIPLESWRGTREQLREVAA